MSRTVIVAEGRDGQVVLRIGHDIWMMPATDAHQLAIRVLRAVSEADGAVRPEDFTTATLVSEDAFKTEIQGLLVPRSVDKP